MKRMAVAWFGLAALCASAACAPVPDGGEDTSNEALALGAADVWDMLATPDALDTACSTDWLDPGAARGRVLWSSKRYPQTVAQYYSYITSGTTDYQHFFGDMDTAVEAANQEWLKLFNGKDRPRPIYPLWGAIHGNEIVVWLAPTDEAAPANEPENVSIRGRCRSLK